MFTLDRLIRYQIKVAGQPADNWSGWLDSMDMCTEVNEPGYVTTILTGDLDQAALIGLLRRLYYLGIAIISINCISSDEKEKIS